MHIRGSICLGALFLLIEAFCYDNLTVADLPTEIANQLTALQDQFSKTPKVACRRLQATEVGFIMYNRSHTDNPVALDISNVKAIDASKKMVLLIHGWLATPNSSGISQLKNAYLKRYDCNVVVVDWSQMASQLYTKAYCHVSKIANHVAKFLCESNLALDEVHIVGHSMGAHIGGVAAKYVDIKCKQKIGRVTGLDPSGPLFQDLPERRRLDKSDARFVDVIHTDQINYGYMGNLGHVDFHPNCGQLQPGCRNINNIQSTTLVSDVFCSHHRSLEYMVESIISADFVGVSCGMCPRYCRPNVIHEVYAVMGEDCRETPPSANKFYLRTKTSSPYAQGWTLSDAKLP